METSSEPNIPNPAPNLTLPAGDPSTAEQLPTPSSSAPQSKRKAIGQHPDAEMTSDMSGSDSESEEVDGSPDTDGSVTNAGPSASTSTATTHDENSSGPAPVSEQTNAPGTSKASPASCTKAPSSPSKSGRRARKKLKLNENAAPLDSDQESEGGKEGDGEESEAEKQVRGDSMEVDEGEITNKESHDPDTANSSDDISLTPASSSDSSLPALLHPITKAPIDFKSLSSTERQALWTQLVESEQVDQMEIYNMYIRSRIAKMDMSVEPNEETEKLKELEEELADMRNEKQEDLQLMQDALMCGICREVVFDPVLCIPCGHHFCESCFRDYVFTKVINTKLLWTQPDASTNVLEAAQRQNPTPRSIALAQRYQYGISFNIPPPPSAIGSAPVPAPQPPAQQDEALPAGAQQAGAPLDAAQQEQGLPAAEHNAPQADQPAMPTDPVAPQPIIPETPAEANDDDPDDDEPANMSIDQTEPVREPFQNSIDRLKTAMRGGTVAEAQPGLSVSDQGLPCPFCNHTPVEGTVFASGLANLAETFIQRHPEAERPDDELEALIASPYRGDPISVPVPMSIVHKQYSIVPGAHRDLKKPTFWQACRWCRAEYHGYKCTNPVPERTYLESMACPGHVKCFGCQRSCPSAVARSCDGCGNKYCMRDPEKLAPLSVQSTGMNLQNLIQQHGTTGAFTCAYLDWVQEAVKHNAVETGNILAYQWKHGKTVDALNAQTIVADLVAYINSPAGQASGGIEGVCGRYGEMSPWKPKQSDSVDNYCTRCAAEFLKVGFYEWWIMFAAKIENQSLLECLPKPENCKFGFECGFQNIPSHAFKYSHRCRSVPPSAMAFIIHQTPPTATHQEISLKAATDKAFHDASEAFGPAINRQPPPAPAQTAQTPAVAAVPGAPEAAVEGAAEGQAGAAGAAAAPADAAAVQAEGAAAAAEAGAPLAEGEAVHANTPAVPAAEAGPPAPHLVQEDDGEDDGSENGSEGEGSQGEQEGEFQGGEHPNDWVGEEDLAMQAVLLASIADNAANNAPQVQPAANNQDAPAEAAVPNNEEAVPVPVNEDEDMQHEGHDEAAPADDTEAALEQHDEEPDPVGAANDDHGAAVAHAVEVVNAAIDNMNDGDVPMEGQEGDAGPAAMAAPAPGVNNTLA